VQLLANYVRELVSNRPMIVVNGGSGNSSSLVVSAAALGVAGYGYIWWKGLSFSDIMFVTKNNMEKAVADLTKKLQHVSDVIAAQTHMCKSVLKTIAPSTLPFDGYEALLTERLIFLQLSS
ncbi:bzip transcription factor, partial [Trifolium pratense]